jgi:hypothetical protein
MNYIVRLIAALALSALVGGAIQQLLAIVFLDGPHWDMLPLLAGIVLLVSVVMGLVGRNATVLNQVTAWLIVLLGVVGVGGLIAGALEKSPGIGGNILLLVAELIDVGFLLPAAVAILLHWWLLRGRAKTG